MSLLRAVFIGMLFTAMLTAVGCLSVPKEAHFTQLKTELAARNSPITDLPRSVPGAEQQEHFIQDLLQDDLTADKAVRIALTNNKRIQAQYERLDLAAARRLASRLLKNPEAEASVKILEEDSSKEVLEFTFEMDLLHLLLLPAKSRRGEAAYRATRADVARAVQKVAFATRLAFYRVQAAQMRLELSRMNLKAAEAAYEMALRLREAGNIKELNLLQEQVLFEQVRLAMPSAELALVEAREDLNVRLGLKEAKTWNISAPLPGPSNGSLSEAAIVKEALDNSLQLETLRQRIQEAAEQYGITRVESILPRIHLGLEAEREEDGAWLAGPMLSVELPLFDFGQADRPAAEAVLNRFQQEYAAMVVEISASARTAMQRFHVSRQRSRRYQEVIRPLQKRILEQTQLQYNAMQLGVFQLLQAKQAEIREHNRSIDQLLNYWIARTELEQIRSGLPLDVSRTQLPADMGPSAGRSDAGH